MYKVDSLNIELAGEFRQKHNIKDSIKSEINTVSEKHKVLEQKVNDNKSLMSLGICCTYVIDKIFQSEKKIVKPMCTLSGRLHVLSSKISLTNRNRRNIVDQMADIQKAAEDNAFKKYSSLFCSLTNEKSYSDKTP